MWFLNKIFEVRNVLEKIGILDFASEVCFTIFFHSQIENAAM